MLEQPTTGGFPSLNTAYNRTFQQGRLSIGLVVPIENYATSAIPCMTAHLKRAILAERLGFAALWLRDVPFTVPSFGDAGQIFDPFVYLGYLAAVTDRIALGVSSIVLPLRHPAHVAKSAASADVLSGGRVLLGIASGDRPEEFPALNQPCVNRGEAFRESYSYIRSMADVTPEFEGCFGILGGGLDLVPKPTAGRLPMLMTGFSQQNPAWISENGDGWMTYPRSIAQQSETVAGYRRRIVLAGLPDKPVMQPLYVDLLGSPDAAPEPLHLGFRSGLRPLRSYLKELEQIGINHVALNLRFNQADAETTLKRLADDLLPEFS